ncbi:MAG: sn-glycerol-1-phosphate dehydrogenase [Clostridia bacterium]|nr:sn-glycerol-1-phosphate dehydrogenase [Clostridia bacterium]
MEKFENLPIEELIRANGFDCDCGVHHGVDVKYLKIASGAIALVPDAVKACGCNKPFVVCDKNTYEAAGRKVEEVLAGASVPYTLFIIPDNGLEKMEPDERALGSIAMNYDTSCDMIAAVGSGVINDLCKVFAFDLNVPQMIIGTAPSMDGFASNSSSMVVNGVKTTLYNRCPAAIILDTDVLSKAPIRMLWAGLGDMAAKYISICEWRIAKCVIGEYYCEHVAQLMRNALKKIMAASSTLALRDPVAVQAVAEGLVLSGFAMSFAKVSRPASGLEHYFSHMWEMMALERGLASDLHGIQVGVGTVLTMRIYEDIKKLVPSREKAENAMKAFDEKAWEARVRRVFGRTGEQVLAIERKTKKNDPEKHARRLSNTLDNWDAIQKIISEELPEYDWLIGKMKETGMPIEPQDIDISHDDVVDAFVCSRDIRDKYLSGSMLWDLGEMDDFAKRL